MADTTDIHADPDIVWSTNDENFTCGGDSLEELITNEGLEEGDTCFYGRKAKPNPENWVDEDQVIEWMGEHAGEECGEFADDYLMKVPDEAKKELRDALQAWARKHGQPSWFMVEDVTDYTITAEDVARAAQ